MACCDLSALRSLRETGQRRAARRLQSRQRHCRLRWRGSRVPARARTRARCARGLRMRRHPSPSSRWAVRVCLSTGRRRGRGEGRRRPQLCRRRSAGSDRVSGVEGGGAKRVWRIHRHEPRDRGRGTPGGGSRGRLYGARRRVRSPAAATLPPSLRRLNRVSGVEGGGAKWVWCATATTLATALAAALATLCRLAYAAGGGGSGLLG